MTDKIRGLDFEPVNGLGHMPQFIEPERVTAFIKRIAERAFAGRMPFARQSSATSES